MADLPRIPLWVRIIKDTPNRFIQLDNEWYIYGLKNNLPINQIVEVTKYSGDIEEVKVLEYILGRRIKHRGDEEFTEYVVARFAND